MRSKTQRWTLAAGSALLVIAAGLAVTHAAPGGAHGVDLSPDEQSKEGAVGDGVVFGLLLRNTGNATDSYAVNLTAAPFGWNASVEPPAVVLPANGTANVTLTVHVPGNATPGDVAAFTVRARSLTDNATADDAKAFVVVAGGGGPDLLVEDISLDPASPVPGESVTFRARVRNAGDAAAGNFSVRFRLDGGLDLGNAALGGLPPNASAEVSSPASWNATAGNHSIEAFADALGQVAEADEENNARSKAFAVGAAGGFDFVMAPANQSAHVLPGGNHTYAIYVRNSGAEADTIHVNASTPPPGWTAHLDHANLSLAPGENTTIHLRVQSPVVPLSGLEAHVRLDGTSAGNPDVRRTASTDTRILL